MISDRVYSYKSEALYDGPKTYLKEVMINDNLISEDYYIKTEDIPRWEQLKGAKKELKTNKSGHIYPYNEGKMLFPDPLNRASRTIITGEGGASPSRFKHVIQTEKGLRRLTPIELERLNMFPDNHTNLEGITPNKRAFFMGNALVVGIVEKIGKEIEKVF
jgi:DNA (cytosine-5)-methyltransferase 1